MKQTDMATLTIDVSCRRVSNGTRPSKRIHRVTGRETGSKSPSLDCISGEINVSGNSAATVGRDSTPALPIGANADRRQECAVPPRVRAALRQRPCRGRNHGPGVGPMTSATVLSWRPISSWKRCRSYVMNAVEAITSAIPVVSMLISNNLRRMEISRKRTMHPVNRRIGRT